jgi:hypothetical protein
LQDDPIADHEGPAEEIGHTLGVVAILARVSRREHTRRTGRASDHAAQQSHD